MGVHRGADDRRVDVRVERPLMAPIAARAQQAQDDEDAPHDAEYGLGAVRVEVI